MVRSPRLTSSLLVIAVLFVHQQAGFAQAKKGQEFIPGTVVSIEKDKTGRNFKMVMKRSDDESELNVNIATRTQVMVTSESDDGFLRPNVVISARVIETNMNLSSNIFTVYLGASPPPGIKQDRTEKSVYDVVGKVASTLPDDGGLMVQVPQLTKIGFEATKKVTVKIPDANLIKEGDAVEVEGSIIKSKMVLNATAVNVTSAEPIKSEEYFAALEERKNKKSKPKTTSKTKSEGDGLPPAAADPFGVLKKKDATKGKKTTEKDGDSKEEMEKKDEPASKKKTPEKADEKPAEKSAE